ncbi:hypothetical protein VHEMI05363 [[Torrubiella] hemipterigena]|uniref:5'-3' DNA helicase ZGRF1-like N-terminal domain-containing protein n=1 Tax=[Torrubiella] hemipterigena TaxID=1531966 RepID=A0A0A1TII7_9HYPO|nr:hypothetical protein VHEMI05363 [[Torrubiella] hemipterigena]
MSYAVAKAVPSDAGTSPSRPTTSIVYEFTCLFTHDLRKKQKRWQDGKLKYHAFNKRVMVYDERGHFVGDSHWNGDADLMDGDEVELDRGSAIVQVAECIGEREQDLTEVLDKRAREVEKRRQIAASRAGRVGTASSNAIPSSATSTVSRGPRQQHVPLSAMLQSPGPIGRAAIPSESPFEIRRQGLLSSVAPRKQACVAKPPPSRKRKASASPPEKKGHAQNLFGVRLNLSAGPPPELLAARARALQERTNLQRQRMAEEREKESLFVESSPTDAAPITPSKPVHMPQPSRGLLQTRPPPRAPPIPQPTQIEILDEESDAEEPHAPPPKESIPKPTDDHPRKQNGFTDARLAMASASVEDRPDPPARKKKKTTDTREEAVRDVSVEVSEKQPVEPAPEPSKHKKKSAKDTEARVDKVSSKASKAKTRTQQLPKAKETVDNPDASSTSQNRPKKEKRKIPPTPEGPRAILCIKPRKRRGLVMLTEPIRYPSPPPPAEDQDMPMRSPTPPTPTPIIEEKDDAPMRSPTPPTTPPIITAHHDSPDFELESPMSDKTPKSSMPVHSKQQSPAEGEGPIANVPTEPSPMPLPIPPASSQAQIPSSPAQPTIVLSSSPPWVPDEQPKDDEPMAKDEAAEPPITTNKLELPAESESDDGAPLPKRRTRRVQKRREPEPEPEKSLPQEASPEEVESRIRPQRRARQRKQKTPEPTYADKQSVASVSDAENSDQEEEISSPPKGPRLSRMARKGIRSIEIIGYDDIPNPIHTLGSFGAAPTINIGPRPAGGIGMPRVDRVIPKGNLPRPRPPAADTITTEEPVTTTVAKESLHTNVPVSPVSLDTVPETASAPVHPASPPPPIKLSSTAEDDLHLGEILKTAEEQKTGDAIRPVSPVIPVAVQESVAVAPEAVALSNVPVTTEKEDAAISSKPEDPKTRAFQRNSSFTAPSLTRGASDSSSGSTKPRIVNPATRGKKAARKEDAAGQMPQCIVPFEPVQPMRRAVARPALKPAILRSAPPRPANSFASATTTTNASAVTFSSASGGPWSRHAHDLLGIGRPGPP